MNHLSDSLGRFKALIIYSQFESAVDSISWKHNEHYQQHLTPFELGQSSIKPDHTRRD